MTRVGEKESTLSSCNGLHRKQHSLIRERSMEISKMYRSRGGKLDLCLDREDERSVGSRVEHGR